MKRDRFASDYEKVRRDAGLGGPEFPEPDDAWRPQMLDPETRQRQAEQVERERQKAIESKAEGDALTQRTRRRILLAEYQRAGVAPPSVDADGTPMASLSLLLSLGWRIDEQQGGNVLVRPSTRRK